MTNLQSFRTAFHGFNRDDVVRYIETANAQHDNAMAAQRDEVQRLRRELEEERASAQTARENAERLEAEKAEAQAQRAELARQLEETSAQDETVQALREENRALREERETLRGELEALKAQPAQPVCEDWTSQELEAYRRAEQAERLAKARAARAFDQMNGLIADLTARLDESMEETSQAQAQVCADLEQLRTAASGSKRLLADTATTLRSLRLSDDAE